RLDLADEVVVVGEGLRVTVAPARLDPCPLDGRAEDLDPESLGELQVTGVAVPEVDGVAVRVLHAVRTALRIPRPVAVGEGPFTLEPRRGHAPEEAGRELGGHGLAVG